MCVGVSAREVMPLQSVNACMHVCVCVCVCVCEGGDAVAVSERMHVCLYMCVVCGSVREVISL